MNALFVGAIVRHLISALGGAAVVGGFGTGSDWEAITGGVAALISVVASFVNKKRIAS